MQDSELHGKSNEQNDRLLSDYALTRRQSRSLYRNWVGLSRKSMGNAFQSQTNGRRTLFYSFHVAMGLGISLHFSIIFILVFTRISTSSIGNVNEIDGIRESSSTLIEDRADEIVRHMEQSQTLMDDNPKSNNDRMETLRDMTEYLTLKRSVKRKLTKSIGSTSKTLSFSKRLKYRLSILLFKIPVTIQQCVSGYELWYSSLKVIEGHFGSSVASYFKFLRKLFLLNISIFTLMLFFVMVPQLLFRFIQYVEKDEYNNLTIAENSAENGSSLTFIKQAMAWPLVTMKSNPYEGNDDFRTGNVFTGEGFLTNTILFYGYYTNTSLKLIEGYSYSIPASYFFTCAVCYILIFFFLFISVAVSYRKCYIEASGGMNNTFSSKIFCGWDFGIATKQAAELNSKGLYIEIKELLDDISKPTKSKTCANTFYTTAISFSLNGILLFLLGVGGMYSWKYLDQQMTKADTATTMMMWLILTLVTALAPVLFSLIAHVEGFESPSSALYMTLIRTFTLYAIVIAVVVAFRLNRSTETECWETILGQDMYRLVLLDFIFGLIGTALSEFVRYRIFIKMWKGIGCPEFDIARSTMNLIYNQTLFYIGLYFSPVLSLIITIKLFLTFYIKKWGAVYNCRPFVKPWKAAQAHTVYLSIAFFAFFSVVVAYGYIITSVKTSNCGPFRGETLMYETLLNEILENKESTVLRALYYITRPGVVGIILMSLVLGVYYMRAVALARIHVVNHLRHLLRLKAEDRKLLLNEISKYSKRDFHNNDDPSVPTEGLHGMSFFSQDPPNLLENSQKPDGKQDKLPDCEQLKKAKISFTSLNNLQNEIEKKSKARPNRNSIFNSVQNLSGSNIEESIELKYKHNPNNKDDSKIFQESNFYDRAQTSSSDWDGSYPGCSTDCQDSEAVTEDSKSRGYSKNFEKEQPSVTQLNFNPVFTESFPFQSDDDDSIDYAKINPVINIIPVSSNETGVSTVQSDPWCAQNIPKNFPRCEERVPSRISFDSDSDNKLSKKKKHR